MSNRHAFRVISLLVATLGLTACDSPQPDGPGQAAAEPSTALRPEEVGRKPHALAGSHDDQPEQTLTIAIYNVLYTLAEAKPGQPPSVDSATLRQVEQLQADVLLLQETNAAWQAALKDSLDARYGHCVFHAPKRYLPEGLATCSRWPITADERLPPPADWFPAQRIRVATPHGPLSLLNVHLAPAVAGHARWHSVHEATRPLRRREIEAFLAQPNADELTIIAGDFNEVPTGDLFAPLSAAGFANALDIAENAEPTWHWAGTELAEQLDHVTYRRSAFELVSVKIVPGGRSDHVPVVVTLRRR